MWNVRYQGILLVCAIFLVSFSPRFGAAQALPGDIVPIPERYWKGEPEGLPPVVQNLKFRSMRDPRRITSTTDFRHDIWSRARDGILVVSESGSGSYGLATHFASILDVRMCDMSSTNPKLGNDSLLIAGILPDGRPGVSAIFRNQHETIRALPHHLLPIPSKPGEVFLRVGYRQGAVYVYEVRANSVFGFIDSDGDLIPDTRSSFSFSFPEDRTPLIQCLSPPSSRCKLQPTPFLLLEYERSSPSIDALYFEEGVLKCGSTNDGEDLDFMEWWLIDWPTEGHDRLRFSHWTSSPVEVHIKGIRAPDYAVWISPYRRGPTLYRRDSTLYKAVSPRGIRPLELGDTLRILSDGEVKHELVITHTKEPLIWAYERLLGAFSGHPVVVRGENLEEIAEVVFDWTPEEEAGKSVLRTESRSFTVDSANETLTISGGAPFPTEGVLRIRMKRRDSKAWFLQRRILPESPK